MGPTSALRTKTVGKKAKNKRKKRSATIQLKPVGTKRREKNLGTFVGKLYLKDFHHGKWVLKKRGLGKKELKENRKRDQKNWSVVGQAESEKTGGGKRMREKGRDQISSGRRGRL